MKRSILVGALVCALAAAPAGASTFVALSDGALVAQSDAVVVAEVLYTYSYWNSEGTMIFTDAVVHVRESITGEASGLMSVRTPGGTVADYRVEAHGFPTFGAGERMVLFLHRGAGGLSEVTGFQQGQYRLVTRSDGTEVAIPALKGVRLLTESGAPAATPRAMPLETLKANVQALSGPIDRAPRVK